MAGESVKMNLIVNYLPSDMTKQEFAAMCECAGPINSYKMVTDIESGVNLGYGFVSYKKPEDALKAISFLNGRTVGNKMLKVAFADHEAVPVGITLFVSGLPITYGIPDVKKIFQNYGEILNIRLLLNDTSDVTNRKAFAFVRLSDKEQADCAISALNGLLLPDKDGTNNFRLTVKNPSVNARKLNQSIAQYFKNKALKTENGKMLNKRINRYSPYSVYGVPNQPFILPSNNQVQRNGSSETFINGLTGNDEQHLYELFRPYGEVLSTYIPKDANTGNSKGYGFVNMAKSDDAQRAITDLDGIPHGSRFSQVSLKSSNNPSNSNPQFGLN